MSTQEPPPGSGPSIWPWICLVGTLIGVLLAMQGVRMAQQARIQQQQQQQPRFR
jgi:hypothetical protein